MTDTPEVCDYYVTERPEFVDFIGRFGTMASVLDIGCAGGRLGKALVDRKIVGCCDGIEPFADAAALAGAHLRQVWHGSMESRGDDVPWHSYDLVMMADVLEHLVDPWAALRLLRKRTSSSCRLALSVPNIRHYKVLLPLLFKGQFRYEDHGIMDRTHLHFFTRESLAETLAECGWTMSAVSAHMKKRYRKPIYPTRLIEPFVAVQYLVMAEKR